MSASLSATDCIALSRIGTGGDAGTGIGTNWIETYSDDKGNNGVKIKGHTLFKKMTGSTDPIVADFVGGSAKFYYEVNGEKKYKTSETICEEIEKNKDDLF